MTIDAQLALDPYQAWLGVRRNRPPVERLSTPEPGVAGGRCRVDSPGGVAEAGGLAQPPRLRLAENLGANLQRSGRSRCRSAA